MSRRRGGAPSLVTISWRDIPAQVVATSGETVEKALLPGRFQRAIDRAAKVAGLTELQAYIAEWRRSSVPLDGDPATAIAARLDELDRAYTRDRLAELVRQGGLDTSGGTP
jgi:hypothetical protein